LEPLGKRALTSHKAAVAKLTNVRRFSRVSLEAHLSCLAGPAGAASVPTLASVDAWLVNMPNTNCDWERSWSLWGQQ
jgi:hypothetical protein